MISKSLDNIWVCLVEGFESLKGVDGIKVPQSQPCTIPIIHQTSFYLDITDVAQWTLPMSITKFVNGLPKKKIKTVNEILEILVWTVESVVLMS